MNSETGRARLSEVPDPYDETHFAIKWNTVVTNYPCWICGERTDPRHGPELFMRDSYALVCHGCGERYTPELTRLVREYKVPPSECCEDEEDF
jgi:hypothetical protein